MLGSVLAASFAVLAVVAAGKARAEATFSAAPFGAPNAPNALTQCAQQALGVVAAADGGAVGWTRDFLLTGDTRVHSADFADASCRGFLAVGAKHTQELELRVQDTEGRTLATSQGPTTTPFVFHCGKAGERAVLVLRMLDGQGEVVIAPLLTTQLDENAKTALARCKSVGTPRPPLVDLGPEPLSRSIGDELAQLTARLGALGYRPVRPVAYGTLTEQQHSASLIELVHDRCYALVAVGSPSVFDLDLRVFQPGSSLAPMAEDVTRRRSAVVKLCAQAQARAVLDIAAFQGAGGYLVSLYELDEPTSRPPNVGGEGRISYAEAVARLRSLGFSTDSQGTGLATQNAPVTVPVEVDATECYAYAAIRSEGGPIGNLELSLLDERGELLAQHGRPGQDPVVFDCPKRPGVRRVVVRARDGRAATRFLLLVGRELKTPSSGVATEHR